jgi:O-antigen/teichoic acid export membrane protein
VSLAMMVGTMLVPHLTHDWEQGRRADVSRRLNLVLKALGFVLFAGAVATLAAGPVLFGFVLAGKYDGGLHVLPWTLIYCLWFSLSLLAESYLWCAERPREACLVYFVGLVVNIGLNFVLVPLWGLSGAVLATAAGNAVALAMALILNYRHGMTFDAGVLVICALPLTLALGLTPALLAAVMVPWLALRGQWCFTTEQKEAMRVYVGSHVQRVRGMIGVRMSAERSATG